MASPTSWVPPVAVEIVPWLVGILLPFVINTLSGMGVVQDVYGSLGAFGVLCHLG